MCVGRHPIFMFLHPPQLQPKQLALCKRPSPLLERRVPAQPSPGGALRINEWLGFSTQSSGPSVPRGSRSAHTSGWAGISLAHPARDHWQAQGPFGKGTPRYEMEVSPGEQRESQLPGLSKRWLRAAGLCAAGARAGRSLHRGSKRRLGWASSSLLRTRAQVLALPPQLGTALQDDPDEGRCGLRISRDKTGAHRNHPPGTSAAGRMALSRGATPHLRLHLGPGGC